MRINSFYAVKLFVISIHLKLELITQFPASNEIFYLFMKDMHFSN